MKQLLLALPLILVASPARAERWVTAASIPYDLDKKPINIVDCQIDINSMRNNGRFTSARATWNYRDDPHKIITECSNKRLMIVDKKVNPFPYWVIQKDEDWHFDIEKKGDWPAFRPPNEGPYKYVYREWYSGAFDLLCG